MDGQTIFGDRAGAVVKVLFLGLGSIGSRHLQNLHRVCAESNVPLQVTALRSSDLSLEARVAALVDHSVCAADELDQFDVAFITNPTALHHGSLLLVHDHARHFFIEKPVFSTSEADVSWLRPESIAYVACPLRYNPVFRHLESQVPAWKPRAARAICSSYLPEWRPQEDYRRFYSSQASLGGGVSLDLIHEIDYLIRLFGFPHASLNCRRRVSSLELNVDDVSAYLLEYEDKIVELHLDYIGRVARREVELFCDDDVHVADFLQRRVRSLKSGRTVELDRSIDPLLEEMRYFLSCVWDGRKTWNEVPLALKVLRVSEMRA